MPITRETNWEAEAIKLSTRIDGLHETLEVYSNEIDMLKGEVEERQKLYDALSVNADAIAREIIEVLESRRPMTDALAILHDAVSVHMQARGPGGTKTATGTVWHGDPVDNNLYAAQEDALELLKKVKGLKWLKPAPS